MHTKLLEVTVNYICIAFVQNVFKKLKTFFLTEKFSDILRPNKYWYMQLRILS